jgi:hypothetical protein
LERTELLKEDWHVEVNSQMGVLSMVRLSEPLGKVLHESKLTLPISTSRLMQVAIFSKLRELCTAWSRTSIDILSKGTSIALLT